MAEETLFASEGPRSRGEIARKLRSLAAQLDDEGPVSVTDADRSITLSLPNRPTFEIEVERESAENEADELGLELEIEWSDGEGSEHTTGSATATPVGEESVEQAEADAVNADAASADAVDGTVATLGRFHVYRDRADEWRWRLVHRNGNIIATSGEGYSSRQNAEKGMRSVMKNAPGAIVEVDR